jgi:Predicted membrane protein (DUF2306)
VIAHLTLPGAIHTVLAVTGILIGLVQLLRPKGGRIHRALGYSFVYAMLTADGAALLVFQFTGRFNVLHAGALANLLCIVFAMVPMLRSPRPANWKLQHYYWISWSYAGLLAAAATELVVRTIHLPTREQAWMATAATSIVISALGWIVIKRNRPLSAARAVGKDASLQPEAASS